MSTKAKNEKELKFIELVSRGMDFKKAYVTSCDKKCTNSGAKTGGSRWGKKFADEIQAARGLVLNAKDKAIEAEVVREAVKDILSQAEVDKRLCEIITGKFSVHERVWNTKKLKYEDVIRKPNPSETARAIDIYNKRFGSYSAEKKEEIIKIVNLAPEQVKQISDDLEKNY